MENFEEMMDKCEEQIEKELCSQCPHPEDKQAGMCSCCEEFLEKRDNLFKKEQEIKEKSTIREMVKVLEDFCHSEKCKRYDCNYCNCETLYNAGYRKVIPIKEFFDFDKNKYIINGVELDDDQMLVLSEFAELRKYQKSEVAKEMLTRLADRIASGIPITLEFIFYLAKEYGVEL